MSDQVNSTIGLTDSSENLINNNTYTPYGTRTKHNSSYATSNSLTSVDTNYTFTGREDDGNGLLYYRNRYYSPIMKRFISEDPIGLSGGINQYAYVNGNPLSFSDPSGNVLVEYDPNGNIAEASSYMQNTNFANMIKTLQDAPETYTIVVRETTQGSFFGFPLGGYKDMNNNPSDEFSENYPSNGPNIIYWDPTLATCDGNGNSTSPALNLLHEVTHATHYHSNPAEYDARVQENINGVFSVYDNWEDFITETGEERDAALILGEGVRQNHHGYQYRVNGVSDR